MTLEDAMIITLDGPSGVGKGTIAQMLAVNLGFHLLDSGALYRLLALAAEKHTVELDNANALEVLAAHMDVQFKVVEVGKETQIIFEGEDVSKAIRNESCGAKASQIAQLASVRTSLLSRQRAFCQPPGLVADGRDMGTVVFPQAVCKFFLTADAEVRAKRRYNQLKEQGVNVNLTQISEELARRDERDRTRAVAPLVAAEDAQIIDTSELSIHQVFSKVLASITERQSLENQ